MSFKVGSHIVRFQDLQVKPCGESEGMGLLRHAVR